VQDKDQKYRMQHSRWNTIFPDASGHYLTVYEQDRPTAAHVERNGVWQCVCGGLQAMLIPACWPNSTVVYNVYRLQTKLTLIGRYHTAHRSIRKTLPKARSSAISHTPRYVAPINQLIY